MFFFFTALYVLPQVAQHQPLQMMIILLDLHVGFFCALYSLKSAIFVTLIGGLFPQIAINEYRSLNRYLLRNNSLSLQSAKAYLQQTLRVLETFRRRHTLNTQFLLHYNRHVVSDCCSAYFIGNFPFNVYALLLLALDSRRLLVGTLYYLLLFVFCGQTFVPMVSILNFIAVNEAITSSVPHLLRSYLKVSQVKRTSVCLFAESWKTASYIELLHRSSGRLELRAGQVGAFTRENVLKVFRFFVQLVLKCV